MALIKLNHPNESYCDERIIALGFEDVSYYHDECGSVTNGEMTIYCPAEDGFDNYQVMEPAEIVFASVDECLEYINKNK